MFKNIKKTIILSALFAHTTFAALLPLYSSSAEIHAITSHKELEHFLPSSEPITAILSTEEQGLYVILSDSAGCLAQVNKAPQKHPGPASYTVQFYPLHQ